MKRIKEGDIISTLEILDKACYLNFQRNFNDYFKNQNISKEESVDYSIDNTIKALQEVVINNDFSYFSREDNIREDLINCGSKKIKIELLKHVVKTYDYYKRTNDKASHYLSYDLNKKTNYDEIVTIVYLNLVKYGIAKTKAVLDDDYILKKLVESFVIERLKNDLKNSLDSSLDDVSNFLIASIDSHYAQIKE